MPDTFTRIVTLVAESDVRISEHGYDALAEDGIAVPDISEASVPVESSKITRNTRKVLQFWCYGLTM